jgi:hypothetical protein
LGVNTETIDCVPSNCLAQGSWCFFSITDDGYLISNYHVVKDATKVRLLTGAGLIDAKLKAPNTADEKFEDVVKSAQDAAVLVLVY